MLLVCVIQGASPGTRDRTNASPDRTSGQGADPRSTSRAKAHTLNGIDMAFVSDVSSVRMIMVASYSANIWHRWSDEQPRQNDRRYKKVSHLFAPPFCRRLQPRSNVGLHRT